MRLTVLIFLTCATGGFSTGLTDLTSLVSDAMKDLVFGKPIDDIAQKLLYGADTVRGLNNSLDNKPSNLNTNDRLELATGSIADGIDVIMQELKPFENFPVIQEMYDTQIRIAMRLLLSEIVKGLVQLRKLPLRRLSDIVQPTLQLLALLFKQAYVSGHIGAIIGAEIGGDNFFCSTITFI